MAQRAGASNRTAFMIWLGWITSSDQRSNQCSEQSPCSPARTAVCLARKCSEFVGAAGLERRAVDVTEWRCPGMVAHQLPHETETRLIALLEEVGSPCEPRLRENQPCPIGYMPRHMDFAPAGLEMWGYSADTFCEGRDPDFDLAVLGERLSTGFDADVISTPRLRFSDERIWTLVKLLSDAVNDPDPSSQLYGDGLTAAIAARLSPIHGPGADRRGWLPGSFGASSSIWTGTCLSASISRNWQTWRACRSRTSAGRSRPRPGWRPIAGSSSAHPARAGPADRHALRSTRWPRPPALPMRCISGGRSGSSPERRRRHGAATGKADPDPTAD